jgi:Cd2+/Zn2+-exporting ATPase
MTAAQVKTRYRVEGMDCASCATKIDTAVRRLPGIEELSVSVPGRSLSVTHRDEVSSREIMKQVSRLGYAIAPAAEGAEPHGHGDPHHSHVHGQADGEMPWWRTRRAILTIACGLALVLAYAVGFLLPEAGYWAFVAALLVGLLPVARRALVAATMGTPFSIEMLMSIAAVGAVIIGAAEEAAMVVLLFLVGEMLEGVAASRARASIQGLSALVPKTALLEKEGGRVEVPAESLAVGSVIVVRPGDRVPADGEILEGSNEIDEAPVTGESTPKRKTAGDPVFAGTINADAVLRVRVTAAAADNTIARVIRLVEEAQESKAPTERFIDRFSRYYTPGVVAVATLVAILPPLIGGADWGTWVYRGLAVLLVGCPCALVISTPAAVAAGLAAGARRGLLMKGGAVLEDFERSPPWPSTRRER